MFHPREFARLLRFGFPAGVHFFIDVIAFTLFVLFLSHLGEAELAASNIFQVHWLFCLGRCRIGLSILVGQFIERGKQPQQSASIFPLGSLLGLH